MKVKDLIEQLSGFDPELEVWGWVHDYDGRRVIGPISNNKLVFEFWKNVSYGQKKDMLLKDILLIDETID